jgi:hypothetical protein
MTPLPAASLLGFLLDFLARFLDKPFSGILYLPPIEATAVLAPRLPY